MNKHTCTHTCTHPYTHTPTPAHVYAHTHAQTHTETRQHTKIQIIIHVITYKHTHSHCSVCPVHRSKAMPSLMASLQAKRHCLPLMVKKWESARRFAWVHTTLCLKAAMLAVSSLFWMRRMTCVCVCVCAGITDVKVVAVVFLNICVD